jgi:enamine deaminase RidA (YjgF/YER057c/UK114 family)
MTILQPPGWPRPKGYSAGVSAEGTLVFVSGQIGWDETGRFPAHDIAGQVRQALRNVLAIVAEAGGRPEHVVRLTWFVTDKREYLNAQREIGAAYREVMGRHYPAMSVVEVSCLLEADARVEIEATAVLVARTVLATVGRACVDATR